MRVGILGPTVLSETAGGTIAVQAAKHRALLAALALHGRRPARAQVLVEAIWGPEPPPTAQGTLQTYVSVVRRALEPDLPPRTASRYLTSSDAGYLLDTELDAEEFATAVRDVHTTIGPLTTAPAPVAEDVAVAEEQLLRLETALELWRGTPYADLGDCDLAVPERARLVELRLQALEERATLLVAVGRDAEAVTDLEALTIEHPLRERPWTLLAVALARTGRQADALAALERLRTTLDEELGLEPTEAVRQLQTAILRHEVPAAEVPTAAGRTPPEARITVPEWPMIGREAHLTVLRSLLADAAAGSPRFATIVGEPAPERAGWGPSSGSRRKSWGHWFWSAAAPRRRTPHRCGRGRWRSAGT